MEKDIKLLQKKILEIVIYFDDFCRQNNIEYYLMGGSALGAIRHKGFIPWDDDLDVFMTYENYQKFLHIAQEKLDTTKYYLQQENTKEWPSYFTKIRMNNTTFIEEHLQNRKMHQGIFIDIMCLNNTSKNKFIRWTQYICARMLATKALKQLGYMTTSKSKKFFLFLSNILVNKLTKKMLLNYVRSKNKRKTTYVGHFFARAKFPNTSFPVSYLGTPRYAPFENILLPVPQEAEKYLVSRFGEKFMEPPTQALKEKYGVHALIWDTEKDYRLFQRKTKESK